MSGSTTTFLYRSRVQTKLSPIEHSTSFEWKQPKISLECLQEVTYIMSSDYNLAFSPYEKVFSYLSKQMLLRGLQIL